MSWPSVRLSRVISGIKDGTHGTYERVPQGGEPLLSAKNVRDGYLEISDNESRISERDHKSIIASGFPRQDDVLLTIVGTIGRSTVFREPKPLSFQRSVCFVRPGARITSDFLNYSFQAKEFQEHLKLRSKISAQPGVYMGDVLDCRIPFPPVGKQTQITHFLDGATGKVDDLIAKQERLIELLAEKRQAIINQAVTKGLDPSVPTKPSGIPWLGDVPEHWNMTKFRHFSRILGGMAPDQVTPQPTGDYPYLKVGSLNALDHKQQVATAEDFIVDRRFTCPPGTLLFPKRGAAIFTNKVALTGVRSSFDTNLMGLALDGSKASSLFILYWLRARTLNELADTSTLPQINNKHIYPLVAALPPILEQEHIICELTARLSKLDALASRSLDAISLLKERRSALISAAVTGKIDVREGAA